jgi:4-methyl-5(b-hydroxyethyl)-thiazole monophosphate biosynthesis
MAKKAIVVFADGFEEIEAVTPVDILRRAEVQVEMVGLDKEMVTGSHGITVKMDRVLRDTEPADAIILPGGMPGSENLARSGRLGRALQAQAAAGRLVAAICAAPALALAPLGVLKGRRATCYPGFEKHFPPDARPAADDVVIDGNVLTSRGPGTAFAFGIALARQLAGPAVADRLAKGTQFSR